MSGLRPTSLSGLLTVSLLLLVLPLLVAVGYGASQLRELSRESDRLVRRSVDTARLTQQVFQNVTAMERSAAFYAVLADPRLQDSYQTSRTALLATLNALEAQLDPDEFAGLTDSLRRETTAIDVDLGGMDTSRSDQVSRILIGFEGLRELAAILSAATQEVTDTRLRALERKTGAVQQWLFTSLAGLVPAVLLLVTIFAYFVARPLGQIDRAIAELGRGALARPIAIRGPSDLEALGRQLEWLRTRLLELAQEKNRFLRHMSHELKTPLANIREGTDLLVDGAVGPLDDNQREVAGILQDNALRLQRLIENLLSFSAWQDQATQLNINPTRLTSLVGTVVDAQRLAIAARDISLDIDVEEISIPADRAKLKLVVDNLLSNALKFTPRGGTIFIRGRLEEQSAVIDFGDTGPGIARSDRGRIFDPFYAGERPQSGPLRGTGIGLSIVREFVQAHGGTVELLDDQFPGAHFRLRLPIAGIGQASGGNQHAA